MDEFDDDRLPFLEAGEWWRWYPSAEEASQSIATKLREARAEVDRLRSRVAALETALREVCEAHRSRYGRALWCVRCGADWAAEAHGHGCPVGRALRVLGGKGGTP